MAASFFSGAGKRPRLRIALALSAIAFALAAGCQPVPQPFARAGNNPLLRLADSGGVRIEPVAGIDPGHADALADGLIEALAARNIPASRTSANAASYSLATAAEVRRAGAEVAVAVDWRLAPPDGATPFHETTTTALAAALWDAADPAAVDALVQAGTALVAQWIQGEPAGSAASPALAVYVWPVGGAEGAGADALRSALQGGLSAAGVPLAASAEQATVMVAGDMVLGAVEDGKRPVELTWTVMRPDGSEIGKLSQANPVPAGTFSVDWTDLGRNIGAAAAGGVLNILSQAGRDTTLAPK